MAERAHPAGRDGVQKLFRLQNNYGTYVVQLPGSDSSGEDNDAFEVLGSLSEQDFDALLAQVEAFEGRPIQRRE